MRVPATLSAIPSPPHPGLASAAIILGLLVGGIAPGMGRGVTTFVQLPLLAAAAGIASTWSP